MRSIPLLQRLVVAWRQGAMQARQREKVTLANDLLATLSRQTLFSAGYPVDHPAYRRGPAHRRPTSQFGTN
jgi:hypothetical protein